MNAPLDRCLCCSLHQGAVVAGNYAIIAYGAALAIYIWWIVEAQGFVPIPAYILVALYLITFVVSVIFVLSLSVQKKTTVLFAWILMMSVFLLPECGFNMWVCIWTLGTSTSKGLGFLVFYILRAVVNIVSMICVHALYTWWNIEKNASKQRVAQIWYGNQQPYYLWNPPMLTYPGYEPSVLQNGIDSYSPPPPPPSRPPRKPKPVPVSAGHIIKHQVQAQINEVDRDSLEPGPSTELCLDNLDDSDEPSKDSALGTEPTNDSVSKLHHHHRTISPKPTYAFGHWVTRPHHMQATRQQAPLWRPFAAVPYSNLKALKAAHAQGVHAIPIPAPINIPGHSFLPTRFTGSQFQSYGPPGMYPPPLPNSTSAMFSNGIIPLYGTSKPSCCALTPYNPAFHRQPPMSPRVYGKNYEVVAVPKNPVPPNTVYDYKRDVEPAFANFIMRQKRGQLGSYRPKSLRGMTDVLRAEALQHIYHPEDPKKNSELVESKRIAQQTIVSNNIRNEIERCDNMKTVNYEAPSNAHNGRFYGRDVIEDWRTMM